MDNLSSLENLMVKQTCRFFAHKSDFGPNDTSDDQPGFYSHTFLKALYDSPRENLTTIIQTVVAATKKDNGNLEDSVCQKIDNETNPSNKEKKILLDVFKTVVNMRPLPVKQWNDLQHYLCFVYRYCMTSDPDPEQQVLSPYFVADMRSLVCSLMEADHVQLCLRLFSVVREYTIFAQKQHQKINNIEASIESLFYYYEAFLSATKNICKIFPELEKLLLNIYKLGWLDFNTSIFMYYFYETTYVQSMVHKFELMKDNVSIKAAGIYTVLTELHKLWRSQMLGINGVIANKLGVKFKGLDTQMMQSHKRILSKNFWVERSSEEKSSQVINLFDYQLFTLVGNKSLSLPEPILNESGQCICEDCLLARYKSLLENQNTTNTEYVTLSCRFCRLQIGLDHFQQHINGHTLPVREKKLSKIISDNLEVVKFGLTAGSNAKTPTKNQVKRQSNGNLDVAKEPKAKIANEPPVFDDEEIDVSKLICEDLDASKMSRKTFYNLLKYRQALARAEKNSNKKEDPQKTHQNSKPQNSLKASHHPEECCNKLNETSTKNAKGAATSGKNSGLTFPCGHGCKLEEELMKSEIKKAYQETCDHHKESKKCDCSFCELFGTTTSHVHKTNETRNRLRIRLSQRCNEKGSGNNKLAAKVTAKLNVGNKPKPEAPPPVKPPVAVEPPQAVKPEEKNANALMNDIHGLLNYIEGNTNKDKLALAEKKAAKKARQKSRRELERIKIEDEERKKAEEERRKIEERLRSEELAKQLAEKAKMSKKENKKNKNKNQNQNQNRNDRKASADLIEETIPAMVTIKRVIENENSLPTVTITLKGSTPDQDKLLYTLVNGHDNDNENNGASKKNKKSNKNQNEVVSSSKSNVKSNNAAKADGKKKKNSTNSSTGSNNKNEKNKQHQQQQGDNNKLITKELRVTLALDPSTINNNKAKKNSNKVDNNKKPQENRREKNGTTGGNNKEVDFNIPMLRLPPGITITKVDGPMTDRNYKTTTLENTPYNSTSIPVSKSGVIVVDTEKLIKQSSTTSTINTTSVAPAGLSKKNKKKKKKQLQQQQEALQQQQRKQHQKEAQQAANKPSMVTLKNPIFQNLHTRHEPAEMKLPDLANGSHQQAAIFKNENGMVTIRSSRLQQSLNSGSPMPNLLSDLKPVLGPEVPNSYMSSCTNFSESTRISPFNAQEILSGLPGIEITKVDKNATRNDTDCKKSCHAAEVSIIPASNGGDKFSFDKDDLHYDSVFTPKDILEDDMDAEERELEAFKRFCQQSVPPKRKEKVAHLNVKDIVLKKKNDKVSA